MDVSILVLSPLMVKKMRSVLLEPAARTQWLQKHAPHLFLVGPPGIEPGLNAPHALVLPVYYGPFVR